MNPAPVASGREGDTPLPPHRLSPRGRWLLIVALLLVALGVRSFRAFQQPVVNPDTIRFVDQARAFAHDPRAAVRDEPYHPLHAVVGGAVHRLIAPMFPASSGDARAAIIADRQGWLLSMQVVGIISGSVVALLIFQLARRFGASFWASLAAGLLWVVGRRTSAYGADGLSDMLFLALFAAAVLVALPALPPRRRTGGLGRLFLAGLLSGLAYLARPEGIGAALVPGLTLILLALPHRLRRWPGARMVGLFPWAHPTRESLKLRPRRRVPARYALAGVGLLALGYLIPAMPYMLAIGGFTHKKTIIAMAPPALPAQPAPAVLVAFDPAAWGKILMELWETLGFAPCLIIALALLIRPYLWGRPRYRLLALVWVGLWTVLMLWLIGRTRSPAAPSGYLDGRHTLPLLLVFHAFFALALDLWRHPMRWWQEYWRSTPVWGRMSGWMKSPAWPGIFALGVAILGLLPGLIRLREPPMQDKTFLRDAAAWVGQTYPPSAILCDADQRVGYYAGIGYRMWAGDPVHPRLDEVSFPHAGPVLIAYIYQPRKGHTVLPRIGPFILRRTFAGTKATYGDVLAIYEREPAQATPPDAATMAQPMTW